MKARKREVKPSIWVSFDPLNPGGLRLAVRPDRRSEQLESYKVTQKINAAKAKANEEKAAELENKQVDRGDEKVKAFVLDWKGMTPREMQKVLAGSGMSMDDAEVTRDEAELAANGADEWDFDRAVFLDFLEHAPVFGARVGKLYSELAALTEAEEAHRRFFSAATSDGRTNEAA